ncbi:hypothetical protein HN532_01100 [archaeon]|nr:hypothetical protein [archaeon]
MKDNSMPAEAILIGSFLVGAFKLRYSGIDSVFWLITLFFAISLMASIQKRL